MTYDDYTAGVELFRATGSLVARPQQIVPVTIVPAGLLWVPVGFPAIPEPILPMSSRPGREPERRPPPLPEWFPPDVGPLPERIEGSRITWSESYLQIARLTEEIFGPPDRVPQLREHTPPDEDLVATLLDFARAGDETAFRELALMRGVPAGEIAAMWEGTVKRVGKTAA